MSKDIVQWIAYMSAPRPRRANVPITVSVYHGLPFHNNMRELLRELSEAARESLLGDKGRVINMRDSAASANATMQLSIELEAGSPDEFMSPEDLKDRFISAIKTWLYVHSDFGFTKLPYDKEFGQILLHIQLTFRDTGAMCWTWYMTRTPEKGGNGLQDRLNLELVEHHADDPLLQRLKLPNQ